MYLLSENSLTWLEQQITLITFRKVNKKIELLHYYYYKTNCILALFEEIKKYDK